MMEEQNTWYLNSLWVRKVNSIGAAASPGFPRLGPATESRLLAFRVADGLLTGELLISMQQEFQSLCSAVTAEDASSSWGESGMSTRTSQSVEFIFPGWLEVDVCFLHLFALWLPDVFVSLPFGAYYLVINVANQLLGSLEGREGKAEAAS